MTVQDVLDAYTGEANYIANSMIVKSFDDNGATYKWLCKNSNGAGAFRREIFIATSTTGTLEDRTVTTHVEISDPR